MLAAAVILSVIFTALIGWCMGLMAEPDDEQGATLAGISFAVTMTIAVLILWAIALAL